MVASSVLTPALPRTHRRAPRPPRLATGALGAEREVDLPADLAARYAHASGDRNPIHLDPVAARAAGLPGVVLHGMATLAIVIGEAERALERVPGRLARVSTLFTAPVVPGTALCVSLYATDRPDTVVVVVTQDGRVVLRDMVLSFRT